MDDHEYDVSVEVKEEILREKLRLWNNSLYAAGVDARTAKVIDDKVLGERAHLAAEKAIKAIDDLQKQLKELK